ncbi:hypothetical protein D3C80_1234460 [compost metagenome]
MVTAQQPFQPPVVIHRGLQNISLFVFGQMLNAFSDVTCFNRFKGLQDFLMVSPESQLFLSDRPQHRILPTPIDVLS